MSIHAGDAVTSLPDPSRPSLLVPPRVDAPELLDLGIGSPADVAASLADLRRINRFLGGIGSITHHLYRRVSAETLTCVDMGAGAADVTAAVARGAARRGINLQMIALDFSARNLDRAAAHRPAIQLLQADANQFPFAPGTVDFVISSLFLHHFTPDQVIALLRSAYATARRGVIMADLMRGRLPLLAFKLLQPVFARSYITRHDGSVSVQRAYTPAEFRAFAAAAGMSTARVHVHHPWFRMVLVADK